MKAHCCHAECLLDAAWAIYPASPDDPYNCTHACELHVGPLLSPGKEHTLRPMAWDMSVENTK